MCIRGQNCNNKGATRSAAVIEARAGLGADKNTVMAMVCLATMQW